MSQVSITFDLKDPSFGLSFVWDGTAEEAARIAEVVAQEAQRGGYAVEMYRQSAVVHTSTMFHTLGEAAREFVMMAITDFVLHAPTQHPERPGLIGDYLAVYDFAVTIHRVNGGLIQLSISANPADDIDGVA